jgi:CubicO group peptidase (beta-lactamase class C family)
MKWILRVFVFSAIVASASSVSADPLDGFDAYVESSMAEWDVPGAAIAIVKDDKIIYERGFGVRDISGDDAVNEHTLFAIGSTSKAFTAAIIAMLVDEGKMKWSDPVAKHLPYFELFDPLASREINIVDLMCHRVGLARGDALWYGTPYNREEILRRIRYLEPSSSFRSRYEYQNIMFLAAGEAAAAANGVSWDDMIETRIFRPLGMKRSRTTIRGLERVRNVATPHALLGDGKLHTVKHRNLDNIAPAGSIYSSVHEMSQWIRFQLANGEYGDKRLISEDGMEMMRTPQINEPIWEAMKKPFPSIHFTSYGLGWSLLDLHGRMVMTHGGGIDGMVTSVMIVPEESLGVIILSNQSPHLFSRAMSYSVADRFLTDEKRDISRIFYEAYIDGEASDKAARLEKEFSRLDDTLPTAALAAYAGRYNHTYYGELEIRLEDGALVLDRGPQLIADLTHWHVDQFEATDRDPNSFYPFEVKFEIDSRGRVVSLDVEGHGAYTRKSNE